MTRGFALLIDELPGALADALADALAAALPAWFVATGATAAAGALLRIGHALP